MFKAYKKFWQNYVNFNGRTTRADYWWFTLANTIIWLLWIAVFAGVAVGPIMKYVDHGRFTQADTPIRPINRFAFTGPLLCIGNLHSQIITAVPTNRGYRS
ncbi:DUF805 domain-containing protein [Fructobacillus cardui]|uniref:DUF805 domain-containing protein n=1 Tax=Fructobacillus cardui TaxID=2893170 RepID=UPI0022286335|nr:DUF805 domain-containing protein [Fructobacillus cardui]